MVIIPFGLIISVIMAIMYFVNKQSAQDIAEAEIARRIRESERIDRMREKGVAVKKKRIPRRHR